MAVVAGVAPPLNTIVDSLDFCEVPLAPLYAGADQRTRIAGQIFMDSYDTCLSLTIEDVKDSLTSFAKLTAANGRIVLQPGIKRNIIAFVQWTRTELRSGRNPVLTPFPIANVVALHNNLKICSNFSKQSELLAVQVKPRKFTAEVDWRDWEPTFVNYLKLIPGITGIPLAYVVRRNAAPIGPAFVGPVR